MHWSAPPLSSFRDWAYFPALLFLPVALSPAEPTTTLTRGCSSASAGWPGGLTQG